MQICSKDYFKILHNERGQELHEGHLIGFSKKNLVLDKWAIIEPIRALKWQIYVTFDLL